MPIDQRIRPGIEPIVGAQFGGNVIQADVLLHLAAQRRGADTETTNVRLAEHATQIAEAMGVRRLIHMSSAGVYSRDSERPGTVIDDGSTTNPRSGYERSKLRAEQAIDALARGAGIETVHLRPVSVFGADAAHCLPNLRRLIARGWLLLPNDSGFINFVHIQDVAEITATLVSRSSPVFGSYLLSDAARITEVADALGATLGRKRGYTLVPDSLLDFAARLGDLAQWLGFRLPLNSESVTAIREPRIYVSTRVESELGGWPRLGWRRGLAACPS